MFYLMNILVNLNSLGLIKNSASTRVAQSCCLDSEAEFVLGPDESKLFI